MKASVLAFRVIGFVLFSTTAFAAEPPAAPAPAALAIAAFEQAIDRLFVEQYPQKLETFFCSLGTNPELGFRLAGSTAEHAASERIAAEMRAMGLQNVRLEPVPVDAYEFKHASLTVGDRTLTASTLAGACPAPDDGITAPLVYAKAGTAADFDALGDVAGKLVLIDTRLSSWWYTVPLREATLRHAVGVVFTDSPEDRAFTPGDDDALISFEGALLHAVPLVRLSRRDGNWLKAELLRAPITATLRLDAAVTLAEAGGTAFNVVGELPGTTGDDQLVVYLAHQDAHFRGGLDDTGGLVALLTLAKALASSEVRPQHTIAFLVTTAEEYGRVDAQYDWLTGAWWAATRTHADWAGRVRGLISLELMTFAGAPLGLRCHPEQKSALAELVATRADLVPHGSKIIANPQSWDDQWCFSAAGTPSIELMVSNAEYRKIYHTNLDTAACVDWPYLAQVTKFACAIGERLDRSPLPYDLAALADQLGTKDNPGWLLGVGADPTATVRWRAALAKLHDAVIAFGVSAAAPPSGSPANRDRRVLEVLRLINHGFVALAARFDDSFIYPHEEILWELTGIKDALVALRAVAPDTAKAVGALTKSPLTRIGLTFSPEVYRAELTARAPGNPRLFRGEQGQLPPPLDLVPACRKIQSGDTAGAIVELESRRAELLAELNARLAHMAETLEQASAQLRAPPE